MIIISKFIFGIKYKTQIMNQSSESEYDSCDDNDEFNRCKKKQKIQHISKKVNDSKKLNLTNITKKIKSFQPIQQKNK
jgi:hypothetical protein